MSKNELLHDLLKESDKYAQLLRNEDIVLAPLLEEIESIENNAIKSFVRSILLKTPLFWSVPSYHAFKDGPPDEAIPSGNVLHTKRVVRVIKVMGEASHRDPLEMDILIAAAILHDLAQVVSIDPLMYDPMHPYVIDVIIGSMQFEDSTIENLASNSLELAEEMINGILRVIRCHHGFDSPIPETIPEEYLEWDLCFADAIARNLPYIIDGETIQERWGLGKSRRRGRKTTETSKPDQQS